MSKRQFFGKCAKLCFELEIHCNMDDSENSDDQHRARIYGEAFMALLREKYEAKNFGNTIANDMYG